MAKRAVKKAEVSEGNAFDSLLADIRTDEIKPSAAKKSDKPKIILTDDDADVVDQFCSADEIFKLAKANAEQAKSVAKDILIDKFIDICVENTCLSENPKVVTPHSTANYQVKHISKFQAPKKPDGTSKDISEMLREAGFDKDAITEIKDHVVKTKSYFMIKPLHELQDGTTEQKALCNKLSQLILDNFTKVEREQLIDSYKQFEVDDSWKNRAVAIACRGVKNIAERAKRLKSLWDIVPISPVISHTSTTLSMQSVLGGWVKSAEEESKEPVEKVTMHGNYKFVQKGKLVTAFLVAGKVVTKLGEKQCQDLGHAENSIRKFVKDNDALNEQIKKWQE